MCWYIHRVCMEEISIGCSISPDSQTLRPNCDKLCVVLLFHLKCSLQLLLSQSYHINQNTQHKISRQVHAFCVNPCADTLCLHPQDKAFYPSWVRIKGNDQEDLQ